MYVLVAEADCASEPEVCTSLLCVCECVCVRERVSVCVCVCVRNCVFGAVKLQVINIHIYVYINFR